MSFRLTYATMFDPPEAMHERFDTALAKVRSRLGARHDLFLNGADVRAANYQRRASPIDGDLHLGEFGVAGPDVAIAALQAAQGAVGSWRGAPVAERACMVRRVGDSWDERV